MAPMKNVLFICGKNRRRSPTAEQIFAEDARLEVASAGTSADADNPLTSELVEWAEAGAETREVRVHPPE